MDSRNVPEWFSDAASLYCVPRWSTVPMYRSQSVAEHSYRVGIIAYALHCMSDDGPEIDQGFILVWALLHDVPESRTGDIPSPLNRELKSNDYLAIVRRICPWYSSVEPGDKSYVGYIVAAADKLEAIAWLHKWGPGQGPNCKFNGGSIEDRMRKELSDLCAEDRAPDRLGEAAQILLGELLKA